jgi:hypothetical protein
VCSDCDGDRLRAPGYVGVNEADVGETLRDTDKEGEAVSGECVFVGEMADSETRNDVVRGTNPARENTVLEE